MKSLAEKYPHLFCRRCERLGSRCTCPLDNDGGRDADL
jgi:hypothetical protein